MSHPIELLAKARSLAEDMDVVEPCTQIYLLSLVDISAALPFEIAPGFTINRASAGQIEVFKDFLNMTRPMPSDFFYYERSPVRRVAGASEGNVSFESEVLPPDQWKYWVVSHPGRNDEVHLFERSALLLKTELEFGLEVFFQKDTPFLRLGSPAIASYLSQVEEMGSRATGKIGADDLRMIGEYYSLIKTLKPQYRHIVNAIALFDDIRSLPRHSPFVLIGLFSIIESLLSHSPELSFFHDSIKHQVRTKVPLLAKRFERELNYQAFFKNGASDDKVLSRLYDYRSLIVHTGSSEMSTEFSRVLDGREQVRDFLTELTKLLLIISLREPQLVTDLKAC